MYFDMLRTQTKCTRRESIHQHTGDNSINHTKSNTHQTKKQNGQTQIHNDKTTHIGSNHHDAIGTAAHFSTRVIRLQQIINGEVMHGKKDAHAKNRNHQYHVGKRLFRTTGKIQKQRQTTTDNQSRQ